MAGYTERKVDLYLLRLAGLSFGIYVPNDHSLGPPSVRESYEPDADSGCDQRGIKVIEALEYLKRRCEAMEKQMVDAERSQGGSWAEIGEALGISRQAAQQRFSRSVHSLHIREGLQVLSPVNRSNEIPMLERAAQDGWVPYRSFHGYHVLRRIRSGACELRRKFVFHAAPQEGEGWKVATIRFPDAFLVRKLTEE